MRCIRYSHSCVRFESGGQTLVIDPGIWSERSCVDGADAVLATHEHADHIDQQLVAAAGVEVFAPADGQIEIAHAAVEIDAAFQVAGFDVRAVGGRHACVVEHQVPCVNVGYIINGAHYHPGDALHVPDGPIETLFVPLQASWIKTAEAMFG